MHPWAAAVATLLIAVILWDAFQTIVLSRRVSRKFRLTRAFYRLLWTPWSAAAKRIPPGNRRENVLMVFGPFSLLLLIALWALGLIVSFALLHWGLGSQLTASGGRSGFGVDLYMSGTTFFTLGLGDVTPRTTLARGLTVLEAGMGFGFLALVIGYLPLISQAFSRREVSISMLDARAGSPPQTRGASRACAPRSTSAGAATSPPSPSSGPCVRCTNPTSRRCRASSSCRSPNGSPARTRPTAGTR